MDRVGGRNAGIDFVEEELRGLTVAGVILRGAQGTVRRLVSYEIRDGAVMSTKTYRWTAGHLSPSTLLEMEAAVTNQLFRRVALEECVQDQLPLFDRAP